MGSPSPPYMGTFQSLVLPHQWLIKFSVGQTVGLLNAPQVRAEMGTPRLGLSNNNHAKCHKLIIDNVLFSF